MLPHPEDNKALENQNVFLAYQTRVSAIFTSAEKSYLTYLYPTRGRSRYCDVKYDVNFQYGGRQRIGM